MWAVRAGSRFGWLWAGDKRRGNWRPNQAALFMFVLVRFLLVFVLRMVMPGFVLMTMGVLVRMTVLHVPVTMFVVMIVSVLVFLFHAPSARKHIIKNQLTAVLLETHK